MKPHPGQHSDVKRSWVFHVLILLLYLPVIIVAGCRSEAPQPQPPVDAELEQALTEFETGAAQREWELQSRRNELEQ